MTVTVQSTFVATLVDEWVRCGVTDVVVAPGSRSTPLALAVAGDARLRVHVHLDERAAGFFALGLGMATARPAVVVTTSGTAAVELHPAVVEASQARVPLLVCTADRPPELHGVGAPQTVEQAGLYGSAVRWFVEPGPAEGLPAGAWRSLASRMVAEAVASPAGPGPVHANLAFRDPLVGVAGELPDGRSDGGPWHRAVPAEVASHDPGPRGVGPGVRGIVVAGEGAPSEAGALGWPVLADPRSGLRGTPNAVAAFDGILRVPDAPTPEVVVRCGAPPASKVLSQWLASLSPEVDQIVVDPHGGWPDPERVVTLRVRSLPSLPHSDPAWVDWWRRAEQAAQAAIEATLATADAATEPGVLRALTRDLSPETTLFVSSSMPIRDVEWFGHPSSRHRVLANRGANGIDGVVSTALGVAAADPTAPVVAVVGDLAFLYDAGALLWSSSRELDLTVVVVDNGGGGIFSFLPQRAALDPVMFERLFGTPHDVDIPALASVYGVETLGSIADIAPGRGVRLVHVRTDRDRNVEVHDDLQAAIVRSVAGFG
ncbi:MAG TPA: 2-succinyl-5-enolpyruvyl-6-hydroxy-3-cyclohexene-1-carboxylic-acid synthase [Acidimicrobiales bacterium]|nr:2-succinyl-5-enolpyruvyl-6-hydroxy-3-cyclohexene-1-carboxylic-acid synthase [Acidimicrobiales bacterium]